MRVKLGNTVFGGPIHVSDVHSFTMSQFRRIFLLFKLFFVVKILKISFQTV